MTTALDDIPYYPGITSDDAKRPANVSRVMNNMLQGSLNVTRNVTVVGTSPATIQDPRIHQLSFIQLMAPAGVAVSAVREGEVDISWTGTLPSTAVRMLIIG
jgi:hypothetical protein